MSEQRTGKGNPRSSSGHGLERLHARYETEAAPGEFRSCGNQPAHIRLISRRIHLTSLVTLALRTRQPHDSFYERK